MLFKMLEGFDAKDCAIRLYNAGLFEFQFPPHDLSVIMANSVIVMSWHNVGPNGPQDRIAFDRVIEANRKKFGNVLVRDTPGQFFNQGTVIPVKIPPAAPQGAPGITKFISGAGAADCAATLSDSGLIAEKDQSDPGFVKITSRHELKAENPDQADAFDSVVRATADDFPDAKVSDVPPELL
jgi:hypothetical protein